MKDEEIEAAADALKKLGKEYYDSERTATIVFWELESLFRKILEERKRGD